MTPGVWAGPDHHGYVVWLQEPGTGKFTYDVAVIGPGGGVVSPPQSLFGPSYWDGLGNEVSIFSQGGSPLLIFSGGQHSSGKDPYDAGCVVGALGPKVPWALQKWSLSSDCLNPEPGATISHGGRLSAAWSGGWTNGHGVLYRTSQSPAIPAATPDSHIALTGPATASRVAEAADTAGNGHVWVDWAQVFSSARDGFYVEDVTAAGAPRKAPGSGTNSSNISGFAVPAIAATSSHPGVFLAYCSNGPSCAVQLWRVGFPKAVAVPGSSGATNVALSAGPGGRLWVAWYNPGNNTVSVVRTNEADSRFGPVQLFSTPCIEHGLVGLSGGSWGRLDIGFECVNQADKQEVYATQVVRPLTLNSQFVVVKTVHYVTRTSNGTKSRVAVVTVKSYGKFRVTDVGDPVREAQVVVAGHKAITGPGGYATIPLSPGAYAVTASAVDYLNAQGSLVVAKAAA